MHHKIEERGLSADYPIPYSIGFGSVGRSYLIELDGHFFQSPAAFYTKRSEWDSSPGYETERILDFTRPITSDCLICHADAVNKTNPAALSPIGCDRCHADGENHTRHPFPGSIVNPSKLAIRERDSVCEQCHLESATVVLNPNRYWSDFHPGERLEQIETHYVYRAATGNQLPIGAVSQAEQLALSACARGSAGTLWCGTCHNPHGEPADRRLQIKQICESCHQPAEVASIHKTTPDDCVSCHMPRRQAVDVSHAAVTDHRIAKHPAEISGENIPKILTAWHDPAPDLANRNLGLAYFNVAKREASVDDFRKALALLSAVPAVQDDPAVCAALGYILLGSGRAQLATLWFQRALAHQASSAEYWLDLGVAQNAAGDSISAIASLRHGIQQDPYDYRPYKALSDFYKSHDQAVKSQAAADEFLRIVPQSIFMRIRP